MFRMSLWAEHLHHWEEIFRQESHVDARVSRPAIYWDIMEFFVVILARKNLDIDLRFETVFIQRCPTFFFVLLGMTSKLDNHAKLHLKSYAKNVAKGLGGDFDKRKLNLKILCQCPLKG